MTTKTLRPASNSSPTASPPLDLENARYSDQAQIMQNWLDAGASPFLPENIDQTAQPIIKQGEHWYIIANRWPYQNTRHHYLIISNQYWTSPDQITPPAQLELFEMFAWLRHHLATFLGPRAAGSPGGALALRFGDTNYSGGTVDHLHWQYIVPELNDPNYERIKFNIGKKAAKLK